MLKTSFAGGFSQDSTKGVRGEKTHLGFSRSLIYPEPLKRFGSSIWEAYQHEEIVKGRRYSIRKLHRLLGRTDYPTDRKYIHEIAGRDLGDLLGLREAMGFKLVIRSFQFDPILSEVVDEVEFVSGNRTPVTGKVVGAGLGGALGAAIAPELSQEPVARAFVASLFTLAGLGLGHIADLAAGADLCPNCGSTLLASLQSYTKSCEGCGTEIFTCRCEQRLEVKDLPETYKAFNCSCGAQLLLCHCGQISRVLNTDFNSMCGHWSWPPMQQEPGWTVLSKTTIRTF